MLEAATSGKMSSLLAARLNVARAGGDLSVLDGLHLHQQRESDELKVADIEAEKMNGSRPLADARRN